MTKQCLDCQGRIRDTGPDYCDVCAEAILQEDDAAIEAAYIAGFECARDTADPRDYNPESDPKKFDQGGDE